MLHHERVKPPIQDYPPNEWELIEKSYRPQFGAQMETILALANGYIGIRGVHEEGGPAVQNGTFINGFHETFGIPALLSHRGEASPGFGIRHAPKEG
jgi:alpha,alpha-trehalose phosphorylase